MARFASPSAAPTQVAARPPVAFTPGAPSTLPPGVRPNKFGANCPDCGTWVSPGEGRLDKVADKWVVSHIKPCPEGVVTSDEKPSDVAPVDAAIVFDGVYTLVKDNDAHRTLRLRTQAADSDFMPGVQLVAYLNGSDNERDYVNVGSVKAGSFKVWAKHANKTEVIADITALLTDTAAKIESGTILHAATCFRCHRSLTVPTSVYNGLGPECARKGT